MKATRKHHDHQVDVEAAEEHIKTTEDALAERRAAREEKQRLKAEAKRRQQQEKLVAPILCLLTVFVCGVLFLIFGRR